MKSISPCWFLDLCTRLQCRSTDATRRSLAASRDRLARPSKTLAYVQLKVKDFLRIKFFLAPSNALDFDLLFSIQEDSIFCLKIANPKELYLGLSSLKRDLQALCLGNPFHSLPFANLGYRRVCFVRW